MKRHKFFMTGRWTGSGNAYELRNPYDGSLICLVCRAHAGHVDAAIAGAVDAFRVTKRYSSSERADILLKIIGGLEKRKEEMAMVISLEAGKCLKHARAEVARSLFTLTIAMEETKRIGGELLPLDALSANKGRIGIVRRFPLGPVAGISPFNFPLNLVVHKLAPAIAVGNPLVLKPATQTPLSALMLAEIVEKAGLVPGGFSVVTASSRDAGALVEDPRLKKLTFTGSPAVGWEMKNRCGPKKITLELGGNAAAVITPDADMAYAVDRCLMGGFVYQGQVCIHLQRIILHESVYAAFRGAFVRKVKALRMGNPIKPETDIGPMIDIREAERVESWIQEARAGGARILCGGWRRGVMVAPTVIENCDPGEKVSDEEVFGPVVVLHKYKTFEQALAMVNNSRFGLQAGVFTRDLRKAWRAFEEIEAGGIVINDVPTFRADNQPYGGLKESGFGREGVKYAMDEMSEIKILSLNLDGK